MRQQGLDMGSLVWDWGLANDKQAVPVKGLMGRENGPGCG